MLLLIDINVEDTASLILRLFVVAKLPQCLEKLERLEAACIKNYHNEQYWSLAKVVLFNFCFAHILAILLTAMAKIDP